ncbi:hypothetical protein [Bacillus cereus]|nr:hypothetical protein [Bacillus cereus]MDH7998691.1 hypothetical protein [Bacillus cereus]
MLNIQKNIVQKKQKIYNNILGVCFMLTIQNYIMNFIINILIKKEGWIFVNIKTVEDAINFHGEKFAKFGQGESYVRNCVERIVPLYQNYFSQEELAKFVSRAIVDTTGWLHLPNNLVSLLEQAREQQDEDELLRQQIQKRRIEEQALKYVQDFREGKRG